MNRNHLALFHAVAQAGSITAAAEQLRISQPAVSKQVAELESAVGVPLLERLPRGVRLTEAGRILADYAGRWRGLEGQAERAMAEYRGLKRGCLSLGASQSIGGYLLPGILAKYHGAFPDIELCLRIENTRNVQVALMDGSVELGMTEGPLEGEELVSSEFFRDELVAIAPAGHPLLRGRPVAAGVLGRERMIAREEGSGTRAVVEKALLAKGLKLRPFLSLASPEAIKNAVAAGLGIAIVSRLVVEMELRAGSLGIIPLSDLKIHRPLHLQRLSNRSQSPAQLEFLKLLGSARPGAARRGSRECIFVSNPPM